MPKDTRIPPEHSVTVVTPATASSSTATPRTGSPSSSLPANRKRVLSFENISVPVVPLLAPRPGAGKTPRKVAPRRVTFTPDGTITRSENAHLRELEPDAKHVLPREDAAERKETTVHPLVRALLERRLRIGASRTEVKNWSGLSIATIGDLENGTITNPRIDTIDAYATALGVEIEFYLLPRREPARD